MALVNHLKSYDEDGDLNQIYRYMDKLHNTRQELTLSIKHRIHPSMFEERPGPVFYDVTSLYLNLPQRTNCALRYSPRTVRRQSHRPCWAC